MAFGMTPFDLSSYVHGTSSRPLPPPPGLSPNPFQGSLRVRRQAGGENGGNTGLLPLPEPQDAATDLSPPRLERQQAVGASASTGLPPLPANPFGLRPNLNGAVPFGGEEAPVSRRQGAGLPEEPIEPAFDLMDQATALRSIARDRVPHEVRVFALQGIAYSLETESNRAISSTRAHTLHSCANALRRLARDEACASEEVRMAALIGIACAMEEE